MDNWVRQTPLQCLHSKNKSPEVFTDSSQAGERSKKVLELWTCSSLQNFPNPAHLLLGTCASEASLFPTMCPKTDLGSTETGHYLQPPPNPSQGPPSASLTAEFFLSSLLQQPPQVRLTSVPPPYSSQRGLSA